MSALRIAQPHEPVRLIDLGPARPVPIHDTPRGWAVVPGPTTYTAPATSTARVVAFRARHGGRVAT